MFGNLGGNRSGGRRGSLREVRGRVRLLERRLGDGSLGNLSLRQREWNRADAQKQKEVKRTSNQVRFDAGINLLFHLVLSSVEP